MRDHGARWKWVLTIKLQPLEPLCRSIRYSLDGRLGVLETDPDVVVECFPTLEWVLYQWESV
jgi:hypothetical protein